MAARAPRAPPAPDAGLFAACSNPPPPTLKTHTHTHTQRMDTVLSKGPIPRLLRQLVAELCAAVSAPGPRGLRYFVPLAIGSCLTGSLTLIVVTLVMLGLLVGIAQARAQGGVWFMRGAEGERGCCFRLGMGGCRGRRWRARAGRGRRCRSEESLSASNGRTWRMLVLRVMMGVPSIVISALFDRSLPVVPILCLDGVVAWRASVASAVGLD